MVYYLYKTKEEHYMFYKYTIKLVKEMELNEEIKIETPSKAVEIIEKFFDMSNEPQETLNMICFDTKGKVIGVSNVSKGTQTTCIIDPREILKRALLCNAVGIMIFHNHPSGDPTPSRQDRQTTEKLKEVCNIMNIVLIDHIIIGDEKYFSIAEDRYRQKNLNRF
jgi:DNA repair protein RadC